MRRIVFVVLHYETTEDTKKCIASLEKYLAAGNVEIVVVDNGSPKGKLDAVAASYAEEKRIHFLYSKENLGFARGNNVGFAYAKNTLKADLIVLANNDLVFEQEDFAIRLEQLCEETKFDVAGPKLISLVDGKNQNPVAVQYSCARDLDKRLIKYYILLALCMVNLDTFAQKLFARDIEEFAPSAAEDFQLHGACMFFANRYLAKYDGLYDGTFMYGEENILKYMVRRDGMNMRYLDDVSVFHKEGSSTGAIYGKGRAKRKFYFKWNIHSCRQLRKLMHTPAK